MPEESQLSHREIEEWFQRYGPIVYRRALVLMGNAAAAEDAVQEVFIKALDQRGKFRGESKASTWLYKITTNHCLNQLRNGSRRRELLEEHASPAADVVGAPAHAEIHALRQLLHEADAAQANCAVYIYVDGMTRPEAAEALGVSLRSVGNLLNKFGVWARERLESTSEGLAMIDREGPGVPDSSPVRVQEVDQ